MKQEAEVKILVVDDVELDRALLSEALRKLGHDVVACADGKSGIKLFQKESPDLVILDVIMPKMDGFECARQIRQLNQTKWIPIIFLSAIAIDEEHVGKGLEAGGDDYLTKPINEVILAAKIKAMQRIADMQLHLIELTRKLRAISSIDVLTGLYNRLEFDHAIKEKVAKANENQHMLALLFVDLDNFKMINDSLGHSAGDALLKEVAERLKICLRKEDVIARLGGDEFAIVLGHVESPYAAEKVAKLVIDTLSPAYYIADQELHVSSSIGIVCYPVAGTNHETLIQNADTAMYHAKQLGRNNYQHFTSELDAKRKQHVALSTGLKFALERNELYLTYQPVFDLKSKKMVSMEALLCWKHPTLGLIPPDIFIPIAEDTGLITPIGRWVFRTACEQSASWYKLGYTDFKISINLSSQQLLQHKLINFIVDILDETQFPSHMLELELTETGMMHNVIASEKMIKAIHDIGIGIVIDDFGVGYSSFLRLKRLPISTLKIDKFFVSGIATDVNDAIIVNALIALARKMNLNVIAEGIETKEHLNFLLENRCPQGQGFFLSKPKTIAEMTDYFKKIYHFK